MQTPHTQAYTVWDSKSISLPATQGNAISGLQSNRSRTLLTEIITSINFMVPTTTVIQTPCPVVKAFQ